MVYVAIMIPPNSQIVEVDGVTPYQNWSIVKRGARVEIKTKADFGETDTIEFNIDADSSFWRGHVIRASYTRATLESWIKHHAIQDLNWHMRHPRS